MTVAEGVVGAYVVGALLGTLLGALEGPAKIQVLFNPSADANYNS